MIHYNAIGLMSGTSLDGLDIAFCEFRLENKQWEYRLLHADTIIYNKGWKEKLSKLFKADAYMLAEADILYGRYLGDKVKDFIKNHRITPDIICSHGHTIFHQPQNSFTFQLGNGQAIATSTGIPVVCDFRSKDVLKGGQGAPLVPMGDELLFSDFASCLNLGGFSNISYRRNNKRIAFDICPVNMALNSACRELGKEYDEGGEITSSGSIDLKMLSALNDLDFYSLPGPKSLGREWFEQKFLPLIDNSGLSPRDKLRTLTEHISIQIAAVINRTRGDCLITGGGAFNTFLVESIKEKSRNRIIIPDSLLVSFKEALIFAFLGVLRHRNENNCLASVTGASRDHSAGVIYLP